MAESPIYIYITNRAFPGLFSPFNPLGAINENQLSDISSLCQRLGQKAIEDGLTGCIKEESLKACFDTFQHGLGGKVGTALSVLSEDPTGVSENWRDRSTALFCGSIDSSLWILLGPLCGPYSLLYALLALVGSTAVSACEPAFNTTEQLISNFYSTEAGSAFTRWP